MIIDLINFKTIFTLKFTANTYGVHPHLTVLENDGNTHAVVIVNSNAQRKPSLYQ